MNLEFDWEQEIFKLSHSTRKVQPVPVFYGQLTNHTHFKTVVPILQKY